MDEVSKRNFATLSEGLKLQRETNSSQDMKIKKLEDTVANQSSLLSELTSKVAMLLAIQMGTGPTKR